MRILLVLALLGSLLACDVRPLGTVSVACTPGQGQVCVLGEETITVAEMTCATYRDVGAQVIDLDREEVDCEVSESADCCVCEVQISDACASGESND